MKPIKGAISAAANKAGRAVAKAIGKRASSPVTCALDIKLRQQKLKNQVIL